MPSDCLLASLTSRPLARGCLFVPWHKFCRHLSSSLPCCFMRRTRSRCTTGRPRRRRSSARSAASRAGACHIGDRLSFKALCSNQLLEFGAQLWTCYGLKSFADHMQRKRSKTSNRRPQLTLSVTRFVAPCSRPPELDSSGDTLTLVWATSSSGANTGWIGAWHAWTPPGPQHGHGQSAATAHGQCERLGRPTFAPGRPRCGL